MKHEKYRVRVAFAVSCSREGFLEEERVREDEEEEEEAEAEEEEENHRGRRRRKRSVHARESRAAP